MRPIRRVCTLGFSTAIVLALASQAHAATFTNGDFSAGGAGWALDSLTMDSNGSFFGGGSAFLNAGAADRGIGISQSVSGFTIGDTYKVSIDVGNYAPSFGSNAAKNFGIAIDDILVADFSGEDLGLAPGTITDVGVAMHEFVATAATMEFMFVGQLIDDRSFRVDNAELAFVSSPPDVVPLPATGLLMLGGLAAFAGIRKRGKSRN